MFSSWDVFPVCNRDKWRFFFEISYFAKWFHLLITDIPGVSKPEVLGLGWCDPSDMFAMVQPKRSCWWGPSVAEKKVKFSSVKTGKPSSKGHTSEFHRFVACCLREIPQSYHRFAASIPPKNGCSQADLRQGRLHRFHSRRQHAGASVQACQTCVRFRSKGLCVGGSMGWMGGSAILGVVVLSKVLIGLRNWYIYLLTYWKMHS